MSNSSQKLKTSVFSLNSHIKTINIKELYIKPEINDVELLKILRNKKITKINEDEKSNIYIDVNYLDKDLKNIKKFSFNSFYPTLLIKLIDNKILNISNINYFIFFKYMFNIKEQTKNTDLYHITKLIINYFYGILRNYFKNKLNSNNFEEFDNFKYFIYKNIKNKLKDNLIYLDTDCFYYIDNDVELNFNIPFEIEHIEAFKIFRSKKYIEVKNGIISHKGLR